MTVAMEMAWATPINSAIRPSIKKTTMSLFEYMRMGWIKEIDPSQYEVIGVSTIYGTNDEACLDNLIAKVVHATGGINPELLTSFYFDIAPHVDSDTNRYVRTSTIFVSCGADALVKIK